MERRVKVLANYLPQYHEIPENDKWWGKGFTDWVSVKTAQKLYADHNQPKIPLNNNYYSLDQPDTIRWQAQLARKYGIDGFAIYHYWFSTDQMLLQKPAEIILENQDIDLEYLFLWDNTSWCRTWSKFKHANDWVPMLDTETGTENYNDGMLAELKYGGAEDWKYHFDYLLKFFKDNRYVKIDNRPVFGFFCPKNDFETIIEMVNLWDALARENGFAGIRCIFNGSLMDDLFPQKSRCGQYYRFKYTPFRAAKPTDFIVNKVKDILSQKYAKLQFYDYDSLWRGILLNAKRCNEKVIALSGFVNFDDTPRRGGKGRIIKGASPKKFEKYLKRLLQIARERNKNFVFITAWNEWGEGAYLEPDEEYGYAYLEAVKNAVTATYENM